MLPETHAKIARVTTIIAEVPAARPSIPSVKLAPLETAVTIKITIGIKRFGEGRRIFLMSPLHHHYQKLGMHESKIVVRFWIVGIFLAIVTVVTLKLR